MSSGMYEKGVNAIMGASIDLVNDRIAAWLIDTSFYTPDLNNHSSLSDVPEDSLLSEIVLTGKTLDGTTFRANDIVFPSVAGGKADAVILFVDTDEYESSLLICYLDNAPEFPITPDGTDITIHFDTGSNGIFKL